MSKIISEPTQSVQQAKKDVNKYTQYGLAHRSGENINRIITKEK